MGDGIRLSHWALITSPQYVSDSTKAIILLSDGGTFVTDEMTSEAYARAQARAAASDNITIFTIGFGNEAKQSFLQRSQRSAAVSSFRA